MTRKSESMMELIHCDRRYEALPGVEELVRGLWRHYPLAICSGALREEIEAMLEGVSPARLFPDNRRRRRCDDWQARPAGISFSR